MRRIGRVTVSALAFGLVAAGLGITTPAGAQAPAAPTLGPGPVPAWLTYDRPAEFAALSSEVRVPMRDGAAMRCTKLEPALGGVAVPGQHPVVITNFFAYRALQITAFAPMAERLTQRGYVTLTCSPRGTGGTAGLWRPFEAQETRDNVDLIEWAGTQPFSNGRVGQTGVSYGGISTYKAVAANPAHLKAAVPIVAYQDAYREITYPGGTRGTSLRSFPAVSYATSLPDQPLPDAVANAPEFVDFEARANAHPNYDAYWKSLAVDIEAVDKSDIPILGIGGWHDLFPEGMVRNFQGARDQSNLLMLPLAHADFIPGAPDFAIVERALLGWFDRLLMQRPGAPKPGTKVTSWELPKNGGQFVQLKDIPVEPGNRLALVGPEGLTATTTYAHALNPFDNGCSCTDRGLYGSPDTPGNDQRQQDMSRIRFDGAPLASDLVILGAPVMHLRAALSVPDANLVVRLQDVAPDGTSTVITSGWLRASHRQGHIGPLTLTPGRAYTYDVELLPTHWRLRAGHLLRITVSTGDLAMIEPTTPTSGTLLVFAGRKGSAISLPVQGQARR
ncbi:MAG: CocE/NonD family hydrolase [Sporichthyaceae bacterium]